MLSSAIMAVSITAPLSLVYLYIVTLSGSGSSASVTFSVSAQSSYPETLSARSLRSYSTSPSIESFGSSMPSGRYSVFTRRPSGLLSYLMRLLPSSSFTYTYVVISPDSGGISILIRSPAWLYMATLSSEATTVMELPKSSV